MTKTNLIFALLTLLLVLKSYSQDYVCVPVYPENKAKGKLALYLSSVDEPTIEKMKNKKIKTYEPVDDFVFSDNNRIKFFLDFFGRNSKFIKNSKEMPFYVQKLSYDLNLDAETKRYCTYSFDVDNSLHLKRKIALKEKSSQDTFTSIFEHTEDTGIDSKEVIEVLNKPYWFLSRAYRLPFVYCYPQSIVVPTRQRLQKDKGITPVVVIDSFFTSKFNQKKLEQEVTDVFVYTFNLCSIIFNHTMIKEDKKEYSLKIKPIEERIYTREEFKKEYGLILPFYRKEIKKLYKVDEIYENPVLKLRGEIINIDSANSEENIITLRLYFTYLQGDILEPQVLYPIDIKISQFKSGAYNLMLEESKLEFARLMQTTMRYSLNNFTNFSNFGITNVNVCIEYSNFDNLSPVHQKFKEILQELTIRNYYWNIIKKSQISQLQQKGKKVFEKFLPYYLDIRYSYRSSEGDGLLELDVTCKIIYNQERYKLYLNKLSPQEVEYYTQIIKKVKMKKILVFDSYVFDDYFQVTVMEKIKELHKKMQEEK